VDREHHVGGPRRRRHRGGRTRWPEAGWGRGEGGIGGLGLGWVLRGEGKFGSCRAGRASTRSELEENASPR
jgi:hypothetical protein